MSLTGVDASPLRAAREWRGMSLVAAARASGVHLAQAEALEEGDLEAFGSVEEMVGAAVLYGATLGIGRDEAMALLDRTLEALDGSSTAGVPEGVDEPVQPPLPQPAAFSAAVRSRSTRSIDATGVGMDGDNASSFDPAGFGESGAIRLPVSPIALGDVPELQDPPEPYEFSFGGEPFQPVGGFDNMPRPRGAGSGISEVLEPDELERTGELPALPTGGLEGAHAASQLPDNPTVRAAMELDPHWRRALEQSNSELDQWAVGHDETREPRRTGALAQHVRTASVKVLGPDRTDSLSGQWDRLAEGSGLQVRELRKRLERSEHATLIVAVAVGILLVAAVVAIASATGGTSDRAAPKQEQVPQVEAPKPPSDPGGDVAAKGEGAVAAPAAAAPKVKPLLPPSKLRLHVLNAGGRTGYAHTVANRLEARKYKVENVGNTSSRYGADVILHPPSLAREAERLSRQTGITTLDKVAEVGGTPTITIIVA